MSRAEPARLYLVAPAARIAEGGFADALAAALRAGDVACLLLAGAPPQAAARSIAEAAQARGVAVLVEDDPDLAGVLGADGVHLSRGGKAVGRTRRALGEDAVLGVLCGRSRHHAMLAGEAGADYVAFAGTEGDPAGPADAELLAWWQGLMTVPCVAMGRVGLADVAPLARAGADFVALGAAVWDHPEGPGAAVAAAQAALDAAQA